MIMGMMVMVVMMDVPMVMVVRVVGVSDGMMVMG